MLNPDYPKLKHNPFVTPSATFFGGGERQSQLNQLRHLAQWSRRLLVVTGAHGMGKTTLFKALAADLPTGTKAARITGALIGNARDVMVEIAAGFGIALPDDASTETMAALIKQHAADQAELFCLVLVDDAHLIEPRAIQPVLELFDSRDEVGLHMVLFAEAQILAVLERATKNPDQELTWHQMPLNALDNPEIREYLQQRLNEAGHQGRIPFSERQIQEICQRSEGNLGRINEYADRALVDLERIDRRFPALHRALVMLLVVVVVAAYFFWDRYEGQFEIDSLAVMDDDPEVTDVVLPPPKAPAVPADELAAVSGSDSEAEPRVPVAAGPVGSDPSADGSPMSSRHPLATVDVEAGMRQERDLEASNPQPLQAEANVTLAEVLPADERNAKPPPAAAMPEPTTAPVAAVAPPAEPAARPAAAPAIESESSVPPAESDSVRDAAWILAQEPSYYTLQLLSASSPANLEAYFERQRQASNFAVFETSRNGQPLYVVLYGIYPNRQQAADASARLPSAVGKVQPWIRTLSAIQGIIRAR